MKLNILKLINLACGVFLFHFVNAQYVAGDISYTPIGGGCFGVPTEYEINVNLYSWANSASKDSIQLSLGDGVVRFIPRTDSSLQCNILKQTYNTTHLYAGCGAYVIVYQDTLHTYNSVNMPNSNPPFYLESEIVVSPVAGTSKFNSGTFNDIPIPIAEKGKPFRYNPSLIDADGDSVTFQLIEPNAFPNYWIPDSLNLNEKTGEFSWNNPDSTGLYTFFLVAEQYENSSSKKAKILRILTIEVVEQDTNGYYSTSETWLTDEHGFYEFSVAPGNIFSLNFTYIDTLADSINIQSVSELFFNSNLPTFSQTTHTDSINCSFNWLPSTADKREYGYYVVFIAKSYFGNECKTKYLTTNIVVDELTEITELKTLNDLRFYPNPSNEFITIEYHSSTNTEIEIYFTDVSGKLVLAKNKSVQNGTNNISISTSTLSTGVYFCTVKTNNTEKVGKLIIK